MLTFGRTLIKFTSFSSYIFIAEITSTSNVLIVLDSTIFPLKNQFVF